MTYLAFISTIFPSDHDDEGFHGLITRIDVLNYLRKQRAKRKNDE